MIDNPREYEVMASVEAKHWWYRTLHGLVLRSLKQHPNHGSLNILDAGCGTGGLLNRLAQHGYRETQGFDLSSVAVAICRAQGLTVEQGDLATQLLNYAPESFDVIISNDTLYHLSPEQRIAFMKQAYECLRPAGLLIMNLPALGAFRGQHDRAVGVTHRFNREEFQHLVQSTSFVTITLRYWPVLLAPLIWGVRTWQRQTDRVEQGALPASDLTIHDGPWGRLINETLFRLLQLERICCKNGLVGSSLFTVLQRPAPH